MIRTSILSGVAAMVFILLLSGAQIADIFNDLNLEENLPPFKPDMLAPPFNNDDIDKPGGGGDGPLGSGDSSASGQGILDPGKKDLVSSDSGDIITPSVTAIVTPTITQTITPGRISVRSIPASAWIFIDGKCTGEKTPFLIMNVAPGYHRIKVYLSGYSAAEKDVLVNAGETSSVDFELTKQEQPVEEQGSISIDSVPPGAEIFIDGSDTSQITPYVFTSLKPGTYTVRVTLDGYEDKEADLMVTTEPTGYVFYLVPLRPVSGVLAVDSEPQGAPIWINGEDTEVVTPAEFDVGFGDYEVTVKKPCYLAPEPMNVLVTDESPGMAFFALEADPVCTDAPEFPSPAVPAVMIIGCIGFVALLAQRRE